MTPAYKQVAGIDPASMVCIFQTCTLQLLLGILKGVHKFSTEGSPIHFAPCCSLKCLGLHSVVSPMTEKYSGGNSRSP